MEERKVIEGEAAAQQFEAAGGTRGQLEAAGGTDPNRVPDSALGRRTSIRENSLIWFGAGVSIAEILTGTYFAPLGMGRGFLAILVGHLIGCGLLFLAGCMGGIARRSAMETTKMSFGRMGGLIFAFCNVLQLVGWTAIMIYDGALSAGTAVAAAGGSAGSAGNAATAGSTGVASASAGGGSGILDILAANWIWCLVIGALICVWLLIGLTNLGKVNVVTMGALFVLTLVLCKVIFFNDDGGLVLFGGGADAAGASEEAMSFGAAVELAVAMPLSWLPLISDYTRDAERPVAATAWSAVTYGVISCWMYLIGLGAAVFTGATDIAVIMVKAGLGIAGLLIIVLSTVTTTFLDAYSAGISAVSISSRVNGKFFALFVAILGTGCAIAFPMDDITSFLYLIGSVFAPMIAVMIADFFLLHRDSSELAFNWCNLVVWAIGFGLYRFLMTQDLLLGNTLPDMLVTMLLTVLAARLIPSGAARRVENL